ncbi:flagellar biosynthesis regulator FlaF [Magnetospira sp. QH-2]|uniref:flagellar biosynthesis regulator FlaF n=1 Tax=Magnetospira sp. (strain QH-2) TaxID=1288970 RepID=UPI0003E816FE|nr:flagellar biosynthesis regulator FlaF [Magnetospira sp. QH-2]CCQ73379.1 putative flagellar protein FlaF [Magnetospira sp. QH-2]
MIRSSHALQAARAAYAKAAKGPQIIARAETEALVKAARLLDQARHGRGDLAGALRFNHRLWSIFQSDLETEGSPLSDDLRRNLLDLCDFMAQEINLAARDPSTARLDEMIAVNRTLAQRDP